MIKQENKVMNTMRLPQSAESLLDPMGRFDADAVPFFPFRFEREQDKWVVKNPVNGVENELNDPGYWILRTCDGYRTWYEIILELSKAYKLSFVETRHRAEAFIDKFSRSGLLWWRKRRMHWHQTPPPIAVLWDVTSKCNLQCHHCVVSSGLQKETWLPLDKCLSLIDEMASFGVMQLILSGGEPLTRMDLFQLAEHAVRRGLSLQIATNATLINKKTAQKMAGLNIHAQVSLDAVEPAVHDRFRNKRGAWGKTVNGIRLLQAAGVYVSVASVVTKLNIDQIPDLYRYVAELGVNCFRIMPFVPCGRGHEHRAMEVSPAAMQKLTEELKALEEAIGLSLAPMEFECTLQPPRLSDNKAADKRIGCDGAVAYCTITAGGEVLPCNYFAGAETDNVMEKSFQSIWENSRLLNYFRSLSISDIHGACQKCDWLTECRGSCIAANFTRGDIFQSNCHCWKASH